MSILVLATTNPGKIAELRALLFQHPDAQHFSALPPTELGFSLPEIPETGTTFAENAQIKALAVAHMTGYPALADDSGLCVDALNGEPGVYSARWTGENATDRDRTKHLLRALEPIPDSERTARFVCAVTLALPDGQQITAEGTCDGTITREEIGENGFGYDPLFFVSQYGRTLAQLSPDEKNAISHRKQALDKLISELANSKLIIGNDL